MSLGNVSVIIPMYNSETTIERALESVLYQTYPVSEIIVVNDGSTDSSASIVSDYGKGVKLVNMSNHGAASARNVGIKHSSHEYIAFLDADDVWSKHKIMIQLKALNQEKDAGLVKCDSVVTDEEGFVDAFLTNEKNLNFSVRSRILDFDEVFMKPYLGTPNVVIRRELLNALGGFDETLLKAEDVDLWIRACYLSKCIYVPRKLTYIVRQESSLCSKDGLPTYEYHLRVLRKFCESNKQFCKDNADLIDKSFAELYLMWGRSELAGGWFNKSLTLFNESMKKSFKLESLFLACKAFLYDIRDKMLNRCG